MTNKSCISCAMPIRVASESASGDANQPYCNHCSNEDGSMKSYEDVLNGMTQFIVRSQGLDGKVARDMARQMMSKLPAWARNS